MLTVATTVETASEQRISGDMRDAMLAQAARDSMVSAHDSQATLKARQEKWGVPA